MSELENENIQAEGGKLVEVPVDMLETLEVAIKLGRQLKNVLANADPSVVKLIKKLLFQGNC